MIRRFCDLPFWEPGMMVHLGAAMRTGKTWFACDRAEADTDALYLLMFPRRTLAYNVWNSRRRLGWGLFYGGSDKRYRTIGEHGVMLTLPSLPFVLQQIKRKFGDDIPRSTFSSMRLILCRFDVRQYPTRCVPRNQADAMSDRSKAWYSHCWSNRDDCHA